ncbi:MAG: tRNA (pseudouridine(54)-N(1))-methyltransferase TrmY [Euryarchaeota archaeon]|nr:tRNA (pseudouridine(54)-N(1))-methyltransferase TrmY [Euryarchaeota archaeon]
MRRFVIVAHRVPADGDFSLNDLCGSGGRVDVLSRAVSASFLLSNSIRSDVEARLVINTEPRYPRLIRFDSSRLRFLNADERSTAALIRNALSRCTKDGEIESSPGVFVSRAGLVEALSDLENAILLEEGADEPDWRALKDATFVLSDDQNFTPKETERILGTVHQKAGLGERILHTDHCIAAVNHLLDKAEKG